MLSLKGNKIFALLEQYLPYKAASSLNGERYE